jgi:NDP-sugar pyrophosphorylase family protein
VPARAVVIAAGEGRRLRPLTERWAKPVLPIDGRPVLAALLRELRAGGIGEVWLVSGHLARQVEAVAGDGSGFGLAVRHVTQPSPDGSADAVARAVEAGAAPPFLVSAADTHFTPGDVGRFAAAADGADGADGAIAVRRTPGPDPSHRAAVRIAEGRVERVRDDDPANPLSAAPLWAVGPRVARFLRCDSPPYELARTFQAAIDDGAHVAGVEIGRTRDLTYPVDLMEENFPYLGAL